MRSMWSFGILLALTGCVSAGGGLLAEVKSNRDYSCARDRDVWRGRAERLLTDQRRPWWKRLVGYPPFEGIEFVIRDPFRRESRS
jgi:hypothetical protein